MTSQEVRSRRQRGRGGAVPDGHALRGSRRAPMPDTLQPQLAGLVPAVPSGEDWLHEIKFDGYRLLARVEGSATRLVSRNGKDWTARFPELADSLAGLPAEAVLDGEVVLLRADGTSNFAELQRALGHGRTDRLSYQAFDLLYLGDSDLRDAPLEQRKRALRELLDAAGPARVRYTDHLRGQGPAFHRRACALGLEGVVSKRARAPYRPGRNRAWRKTKCVHQLELLVGGFTELTGERRGLGALLLGGWQDGRLAYAGRVGTGFDARQRKELRAALQALQVDDPPFEPAPAAGPGVHWVRPRLVVEVAFSEWTGRGVLRHPSFRGLREDKEPGEVRLPSDEERAAVRSASRAASHGPAGGSGSGRAHPRPPGRAVRRSSAAARAEVAGVTLSHPDRVLYPDQGVTKLALARYLRAVAPWILPGLARRPLALLRCPEGATAACFFQKHPGDSLSGALPSVAIEGKDGVRDYVHVASERDLVALAQVGTLELHPWGSHIDDPEHPDVMIFDLDPGPGVSWRAVLDAARGLRSRLSEAGLSSFPRLTGGKGLHLVVPLQPHAGWATVNAAAGALAAAHARDEPTRFTTSMSRARRRGRIYLDTLRNARGATAIASYSTRARAGAPVATPLRWDELSPSTVADRYHIGNLRRRLAALAEDPWLGFEAARRPLDGDLLQALGVDATRGRAAGATESS